MMHNWSGGWGGGWGWGAWLAMALMMLVFWGGLITVIVVAFRSWGRHGEASAPGATSARDDALGVLDGRFARGEIDAEEYASRRDLLRRS